MNAVAMTSAAISPPRADTVIAELGFADVANAQRSDALWTSITLLSLFRVVATTLFVGVSIVGPMAFGLGDFAPRTFIAASGVYCALAIGFLVLLRRLPLGPQAQLTIHVVVDIALMTVLTYASGGFRSGLGVVNLVVLASAALVADRKTTLFYAALASLAILFEHAWWLLRGDLSGGTFVPVGLLATGYFATAVIVNRLSARVRLNEQMAHERGRELLDQSRVNDLVIQDVQDGVLVVASDGAVRQHNRQALGLLGLISAPRADQRLSEWAPELGAIHARLGRGTIEVKEAVLIARTGRRLQVRIQGASSAAAGLSLVFLEDLSRVEEEAQKLKLVALGRLTANIAHEIRNPLSAITYAADLLGEENRAAGRDRLTRIIRDNAYRLDRMVRDVMELNRRDAAQPEPITLAAFIVTFLADFARFEKVSDGTFAVAIPASLMVQFDRIHLHQVLWNLVRNAQRYSSQTDQAVVIAARARESAIATRGNQIELFVGDDGAGVAEEIEDRLFEPFFTTISKGTGLGLYIAREWAVANGAQLDYVARRARGTLVSPLDARYGGGVFRLRMALAIPPPR